MSSWLSETIDKIHAGVPQHAWDEAEYRKWLREMYRAMDFLMRSGSWGAVNAYLLQQQQSHNDEPKLAIVILRFLSDAPRDKLPEWAALLWRVGVALDAKGLDRARMLRGLE